MTEGTVATWLKKVGDKLNEGDILAEIETDKATMEFESFHSGTLLYIGIKEGESASVDSLLAIIGPAGTDVSALVANGAKSIVEPASTEVKTETKQEVLPVVATTNDANGRIFASPLAKKIAQDKGINLSQIKGTGENGRITKKDVEDFTLSAITSVSAESKTSANVISFVPEGQEATQEVKNSQMRKTIAKRLSESKFTAPHYKAICCM